MNTGFQKFDHVISCIEDACCVLSIAVVTIIVTMSVIGRYIFHADFLWAGEVDQALLVAVGMFGSARAVRTNGHTEFTAVSNKPKSRKVRIAIRLIISIITVSLLVLLFVTSVQYTAAGFAIKTTVLKIPRGVYYSSISIGFGLCVYEFIKTGRARIVNDKEN